MYSRCEQQKQLSISVDLNTVKKSSSSVKIGRSYKVYCPLCRNSHPGNRTKKKFKPSQHPHFPLEYSELTVTLTSYINFKSTTVKHPQTQFLNHKILAFIHITKSSTTLYSRRFFCCFFAVSFYHYMTLLQFFPYKHIGNHRLP